MRFHIPAAVTSRVARQVLVGKKHSPTILFAAGIVGVGISAVMVRRATLKAEIDLDDNRKDLEAVRTFHAEGYTEQDRRGEISTLYIRKVLIVSRAYAPSVAVGLISIAALTGSHKILTDRNAGLTAAYAALDKFSREYRKRVAEEVGEDREKELRYEVSQKAAYDEKKGKVVRTGVPIIPEDANKMYGRFFDETCSSWERSSPETNWFFIQCQQKYANDMLKARGHLFLNEVYDMFGFAHTKAGAMTGWVRNSHVGDGFVDFGIFKDADAVRVYDIVAGRDGIWLDFNVDGVILDLI